MTFEGRPGWRCYLALIVLLVVLWGCGSDSSDEELNPERVLDEARVDLLAAEPYLFPATIDPGSPPVLLVLRRWDLIFAGGYRAPLDEDPAIEASVADLIPGPFDHILVYLGKDGAGRAYAAELNVDSLSRGVLSVSVKGDLRVYCLGLDGGNAPHPSGAHLFDPDHYRSRWALTPVPELRNRLLAHDTELLAALRADLAAGFPYQLEFETFLPSIQATGELRLVDDGRRNGAGCSDYWTSLFEDVAGVCWPGVRISVAELIDYFRTDPVGREAMVPAVFNPFGNTPVRVGSLLDQGLTIVPAPPHDFPCAVPSEQGLVTPTRLFFSNLLQETETVSTWGE